LGRFVFIASKTMLFACRSLIWAIGLMTGIAAGPAAAADGDAPRDPLMLATHTVWLRLLHYGSGPVSEVTSAEFFLSARGSIDPAAELSATLSAHDAPWTGPPDQHPRCRFPARYHWLWQQGVLPQYVAREPRCVGLERWAQFDRLRSLSVLLVSGYLGSPASNFGHTLLKFNTGSSQAEGGLLDLSFNFGALIPDKEPTLLYIARGLSGGYEAGFSDKYFYTQDLVYLRTEFRDIWDYELELSDTARYLLVTHLWELVGKKFTYYFLTKNCAYRIAELLELVTGETLLDNTRVWYIPAELFHRLHDIERRHARRWIRSLRFVPSSQRVLQHRFDRLSEPEVTAANAAITRGDADVVDSLRGLSVESQVRVTDALIAYQDFRLVAAEPDPPQPLRAAKDAALRARLQLPPGAPADRIEPIRSPALGNPPMLGSVGLERRRDGRGAVSLRWAPAHADALGDNSLEGSELVVMDTRATLADREGLRLQHVDFMRLRRLNIAATAIEGENRWSWQAGIGARRYALARQPQAKERLVLFGAAGAGKAMVLRRGLVAYAMLDAIWQSGSVNWFLEPHAGLLFNQGPWRAAVTWASPYDLARFDRRERVSAEVSRHLSETLAMRLEVLRDKQTMARLSLLQYW
jgi:Domain of unknown function (DUF4105)